MMTNLEYDALYDELEALEKETGVVMAGSPTMTVGYQVLSDLPKKPIKADAVSGQDKRCGAAHIVDRRSGQAPFMEAGRADHRADI